VGLPSPRPLCYHPAPHQERPARAGPATWDGHPKVPHWV